MQNTITTIFSKNPLLAEILISLVTTIIWINEAFDFYLKVINNPITIGVAIVLFYIIARLYKKYLLEVQDEST